MVKKATKNVGFRIDPDLLQSIKETAETEGLPYQTLIKYVLRNYIKEYKKGN